MMIQKNENTLKYVSLIALTLQNAVLGLSMRYSRIRAGDLFISSTAVLMSEVFKLITSLVLVFNDEGRNVKKFLKALHKTVIANPIDTLKVCVPSFIYIIQNNLLYLSASHLDAATYQVTYQLKVLTTAIFAVIILKKKLLLTQWGSLFVLILGVILVQLAKTETTVTALTPTPSIPNGHEQNRIIGLLAAIGACIMSGFGGIYFEKILKGADISVWLRNVQLSLLSLPIGAIACLLNDGRAIHENGFFFGYDLFIWYLILLQSGGGLIVAVVVKYADNILKGFATSLAIIISCVASIYFFNFQLSIQFAIGAGLVIASIFMYSYDPEKQKKIRLAALQKIEEEKLANV